MAKPIDINMEESKDQPQETPKVVDDQIDLLQASVHQMTGTLFPPATMIDNQNSTKNQRLGL